LVGTHLDYSITPLHTHTHTYTHIIFELNKNTFQTFIDTTTQMVVSDVIWEPFQSFHPKFNVFKQYRRIGIRININTSTFFPEMIKKYRLILEISCFQVTVYTTGWFYSIKFNCARFSSRHLVISLNTIGKDPCLVEFIFLWGEADLIQKHNLW
jgi:hypothetical protein